MENKILISIAIIFSLIPLYYMFRSGHFIKNLLSTSIQGALGFIAVNLIGMMTGITLTLNSISLIAAGLYGIPGCITLVIADCFLGQ